MLSTNNVEFALDLERGCVVLKPVGFEGRVDLKKIKKHLEKEKVLHDEDKESCEVLIYTASYVE